jgi:type IV pilus assembly protein PilV
MNMRNSLPNKQAGSMLLEALIAILIFSMGILAIVGLQAASLKSANDARYRTTASLLANELIGQMWVSDRTTANALQTKFNSPGGAAYTAWLANVQNVQTGLPGVANTTVNVAADRTVTISISWKSPSEPTAHTYVAVAQIQ